MPLPRLPLGLLCAWAALTVACQVVPAPQDVGVRVRGQVLPSWEQGALQAAGGFGLLQLGPLPPVLQPSDVAWVGLHLIRVGDPGGERFLGELPGLGQEIDLRNLQPNASYRLRLEAFDQARVRLDAGATSSVTDFATGGQWVQNGMSFLLKLRNTPYVGKGAIRLTPDLVATGAVDQPDPLGPRALGAQAAEVGMEVGASVANPVVLKVGGDYLLASLVFAEEPNYARHLKFEDPFLIMTGKPTIACKMDGPASAFLEVFGFHEPSALRTTRVVRDGLSTPAWLYDLDQHQTNSSNTFYCGGP